MSRKPLLEDKTPTKDKRFKVTINDIDVFQTCEWAPEQYDVLLKDTRRIIGYIRLRHSELSIDIPDCRSSDASISIHKFRGTYQGSFADRHQRNKYMNICLKAIIDSYNETGKSAKYKEEVPIRAKVKFSKGKIINHRELKQNKKQFANAIRLMTRLVKEGKIIVI